MQKDDVIYRQDAIDILDAYQVMIENGEKPYAWARLRMSELPSAQPEQRWILCEEWLPEEKDAGILKKLGTNKRSEYVLATVEVKGERMTVTACTYDGVWHWDKKYAFPDYKVIAWMPLPEPYAERREG